VCGDDLHRDRIPRPTWQARVHGATRPTRLGRRDMLLDAWEATLAVASCRRLPESAGFRRSARRRRSAPRR
jgi:hypothetical protein